MEKVGYSSTPQRHHPITHSNNNNIIKIILTHSPINNSRPYSDPQSQSAIQDPKTQLFWLNPNPNLITHSNPKIIIQIILTHCPINNSRPYSDPQSQSAIQDPKTQLLWLNPNPNLITHSNPKIIIQIILTHCPINNSRPYSDSQTQSAIKDPKTQPKDTMLFHMKPKDITILHNIIASILYF